MALSINRGFVIANYVASGVNAKNVSEHRSWHIDGGEGQVEGVGLRLRPEARNAKQKDERTGESA
jgi:hypothetical protein